MFKRMACYFAILVFGFAVAFSVAGCGGYGGNKNKGGTTTSSTGY